MKELINNLKKTKKIINEFNSTIPNKIASEVKTEIQKHTPVDTGNLRNSINANVSGNMVEWYSDSDYATFVELGHLSRGGSFVEGAGMFAAGEKQIDRITEEQIKKLENKMRSIWG